MYDFLSSSLSSLRPIPHSGSMKGFVEGWGLSRRNSWRPQNCKLGLRSKMQEVGALWMEAMGSCRAVRQERISSLEGTVRLIGDGFVWKSFQEAISEAWGCAAGV